MWQSLFLVSIAQALFLMILMFAKTRQKSVAFYLIMLLLFILCVTNIDFYFVSSHLYVQFPYVFGTSFGLMFLFGPIFYLYVQVIIHANLKWRPKYLLHFIPYGINLLLNLPILFLPAFQKIEFINFFLRTGMQLRMLDKTLISCQCAHLLIYLFITQKTIRNIKPRSENNHYTTSLNKNKQWINVLFISFLAYEVTVLCLFVKVLSGNRLFVESNYIYTLLTSFIIYVVAYSLILNADLLNPGFVKKYKNSKEPDLTETNIWLERLNKAMQDRIYTNSDLNLELLAKEVNIPKNQLSRLINEKFQKSFNEYINDYRVKEFISLIDNPGYQSFNLYGIALEAGFNNKSTFNAAFKKFTGKTPSEYKKTSRLRE